MSANTAGLDWPIPPEVEDPQPAESRRAWGKLSYEERYRRQRGDLTRAAARIASRKGFHGTRIADIVAEAGLSKGTFYEHFDSKEDCFLDLYRRTNSGMLRAGIQAAEANFHLGAYTTVLGVVRALTGYASRDPRLAQAIGGMLGAAVPAMRAEADANRERIIDLFVVVSRRLHTSLETDELRLSARVLVYGVISVLPGLRRRGSDLNSELEAVARLACRGLGLEEASDRQPNGALTGR